MGIIISDNFNLKNGFATITFTAENVETKNDLNHNYNNLNDTLKSTLENISPEQTQKIIVATRLVLKDYDEENLFINIVAENLEKVIEYENKELVLFEQTEPYKENVQLKTTYNNRDLDKKYNGIACALLGEHFDSLMVQPTKDGKSNFILLSEYAKLTEYSLQNLKNISKISDLAIILCNLYRVFYNENPNFKENDTLTKIQVMLYILSYYRLIEGFTFTNSSFRYDLFDQEFEASYMPTSEEIANIVKNYIIPCTIPITNENISIENKDKISAIGSLIRETCDNDIHKLVRLSIFIHLNSQAKFPIAYANVLEKNYLDGEVNEDQKLLARIKEKLHIIIE